PPRSRPSRVAPSRRSASPPPGRRPTSSPSAPRGSSSPYGSIARAPGSPPSRSDMPEKTWYMACLDLEGADCLVVGGGSVGLEKARGLLDAGARVTVVAPEIGAAFECLPVV